MPTKWSTPTISIWLRWVWLHNIVEWSHIWSVYGNGIFILFSSLNERCIDFYPCLLDYEEWLLPIDSFSEIFSNNNLRQDHLREFCTFWESSLICHWLFCPALFWDLLMFFQAGVLIKSTAPKHHLVGNTAKPLWVHPIKVGLSYIVHVISKY